MRFLVVSYRRSLIPDLDIQFSNSLDSGGLSLSCTDFATSGMPSRCRERRASSSVYSMLVLPELEVGTTPVANEILLQTHMRLGGIVVLSALSITSVALVIETSPTPAKCIDQYHSYAICHKCRGRPSSSARPGESRANVPVSSKIISLATDVPRCALDNEMCRFPRRTT